MTRLKFDTELHAVRDIFVEMSTIVTDMVLTAVEAAITEDPELAAQVVTRDEELDNLEEAAMRKVTDLVVLQAPVSKDARFLRASLAVVGELEQAGDDAVKLARRVRKIGAHFPAEFRMPLGALAESVVQMIHDVVVLVEHFDDDEAQRIIDSDGQIDGAYKQARTRVFELIEGGQDFDRQMLRTIEIFHSLEHVADHAVEIARRMRKFHAGIALAPQ